jgi:hypothetical protein
MQSILSSLREFPSSHFGVVLDRQFVMLSVHVAVKARGWNPPYRQPQHAARVAGVAVYELALLAANLQRAILKQG